MKVLFLNPPFGHNRPEGLDAPLGIMCLGARLQKEGHECRLVDHAWETQDDWSTWDRALAGRPDLVIINTQIRFEGETGEGARRAKNLYPNALTVAVGPQASTEPARLLGEFDFDAVVVGEPDEVVSGLCRNFPVKKDGEWTGFPQITGLASSEHPLVEPAPRMDMNALPEPDYDLADYGRYIQTTHNAVFVGSRGIDHEDAFYQPPLIPAVSPTSRANPDKVIQGIRYIRDRFPGSYMLLFHDEAFTEDRAWVREVCALLKEARLGLPFWCFTRPDLLDDDLAGVMKKSGFAGVSMGMESACAHVLDTLERGLGPGDIKKGFDAARRAGLLITGSVMLGTPGETRKDILATAEMLAERRPDILTVTLTTPLPGSRLYKKYKDRLLAKTPSDFNYYAVWPGKYPMQLDDLTADDLSAGVALIRKAWKRGLWRTAGRVARAALENRAFGRTVMGQVTRVAKRKVWGGV